MNVSEAGLPARSMSRRSFSKLLAASGGAWWSLHAASRAVAAPNLPPAPARPDEAYWRVVREQFMIRPGLSPMNAANLCPSPQVAWQILHEQTEAIERDPSFENRAAIGDPREATRTLLAEYIRATPEEILLTRNTSEASNLVSLGLDLGAGDEVIVFADNHPSNRAAWHERAKRHRFTVVELPVPNPHPGAAAYVEAVRQALTPKTRVLAFSHLTNTAGDLFPAVELCRLAREHGVLTLVDGAQTFGLLEIDLAVMQPDFYSGSAHKWPCGPKEVGFLFASQRVHDRFWPSIVSAGGGKTGLSRTHEGFGQRDEPALAAFGATLRFLQSIGAARIEARSRELGQRLMQGLRELPEVRLWTNPDPALSVAVVVFQPGSLSPAALAATLYREHGIACTARGGTDRPGLRLSPHFYNLSSEVDRTLEVLRHYLTVGLTATT